MRFNEWNEGFRSTTQLPSDVWSLWTGMDCTDEVDIIEFLDFWAQLPSLLFPSSWSAFLALLALPRTTCRAIHAASIDSTQRDIHYLAFYVKRVVVWIGFRQCGGAFPLRFWFSIAGERAFKSNFSSLKRCSKVDRRVAMAAISDVLSVLFVVVCVF